MLPTQNCNKNEVLETRETRSTISKQKTTTTTTTIKNNIKKLQEEHKSNSKITIKKLTSNKGKFNIQSVSFKLITDSQQQQQQQQQTLEPTTHTEEITEDKRNNEKMSTKKSKNRQQQKKCVNKKRRNLIVKLPIRTPEPKNKYKQSFDSPESLVFVEKNQENVEEKHVVGSNLESQPLSPASTTTISTNESEKETYQEKSSNNETVTSSLNLQLASSGPIEEECINETKVKNNIENVGKIANEDATHESNPCTSETCANVGDKTLHQNDDQISDTPENRTVVETTVETPKSLTAKRIRKNWEQSENGLRRSQRIKSSPRNKNLAPIYKRDMIIGVDGKKTCVRSIVGFERINNDLVQFRERFFNRLFEMEKKSKNKKHEKSKTTTTQQTKSTNESFEIYLNNESINHNKERIEVKDPDTQSYKKKDIIKFKASVENKKYIQIDDGIWVSKITSCKGILRLDEDSKL